MRAPARLSEVLKRLKSRGLRRHARNLVLVTSCLMIKEKRGMLSVVLVLFFYLFLRSNANAMPTIAIAATMMPIPGRMYWSASDAGACVGCGVASGASLA